MRGRACAEPSPLVQPPALMYSFLLLSALCPRSPLPPLSLTCDVFRFSSASLFLTQVTKLLGAAAVRTKSFLRKHRVSKLKESFDAARAPGRLSLDAARNAASRCATQPRPRHHLG